MPARKVRTAFTWETNTSRYRRTKSGQFLARATVDRSFEFALAKNRREVRELSRQLQAGEISIRRWQTGMASKLKEAHIFAAQAARGGRLTQADYGRIGRLVRDRYHFLDQFGGQIASGAQPLNGRFLIRAESYVLHARQARHEAERTEMLEVQGKTFEENRLHATESCQGCLDATAMGKVAIGVLPAIGARSPCLMNCRCQIVYS